MEKVYISKCDSYIYDEVERAVFECLDGLGQLKDKLAEGSRVLIKANLLMRKRPEEATTTHPAVVEAIVRYVQSKGCKAIIGDSPGGPFTEKMLKGVYNATGMTEVAEKTGCELNFDISDTEVWDSNAKLLKSMRIINAAKEADLVISACKMKTHGMMTYTGAVKNLFGAIPGLTKAEYHFKMNDAYNFAEHLIDICEHIKPVVSIMDAIDAMEGNGPSSGDIKHVGLVLASLNPYALDTAAANIMGLKPGTVPTIKAAAERGLFSGDMKDVKVSGESLSNIKIEPFKLPDSVVNINFGGSRVPRFMGEWLAKTFRPSPVFDMDKCIACGDCKRSCPPDIIDMSSGKPVPDLNKCIRCFCCHELCPKKAIEIKKHWLYKKLFK